MYSQMKPAAEINSKQILLDIFTFKTDLFINDRINDAVVALHPHKALLLKGDHDVTTDTLN